MAVAVAAYLSVNAGASSARGWACHVDRYRVRARMLALIGPRFPERLRAFLLTVVVVDDVVALLVIATFYTRALQVPPCSWRSRCSQASWS